MALYTEKSFEEAHRPLAGYSGDNAFVKGQIYAMNNGGDMYRYSNNLANYSKALEDAKANDNDNFLTGLGDFFVGRGADKLKADAADEYIKAFSGNPYEFDGENYNDVTSKIKTEKDLEQGRAFDGGIIGSLINPITQVGKAGADLGAGLGGNWDAWNKRDHLSDIGALGETALTLAPSVGAGIKALRGGSSVANGIKMASKLGKAGSAVKSFTTAHPALARVGKNALGMGSWSALGALNEYGSDIGNHIPEAALKVGMDTTLGALTGGIGYGIDKFADRAKVVRDMSDLYQQYLKQQKGSTITDSSKLLGDGMGGATSVASPTPRTATEEWLMNRGNLAKTKLGQAIQGVGDEVSYRNLTGTPVTNKLSNLANKINGSKVGTNVANLLKTKKGKVGLGISAGLLINKLMNGGGGSNDEEMSDAEMQELYNYIYGGGQ